MEFKAQKLSMTQVFGENGRVQTVTVLKVLEDSYPAVTEGETISVQGVSKGKGFQGVVKRHGFKGGRRTHGQKHSEREAGSISGGGRAGGRVAKGLRMAGRMGGDKVTVKNLEVVKLLPETNEVLVSGAVPGRRGTKILVKTK